MGRIFYFLGFEMSLYVPLFVILIFYLAFRLPAVLMAFFYKAQHHHDYWYVVLIGNAAAFGLLVYYKLWQYTPEPLIQAVIIIAGIIAVTNFINWRRQLKQKSR